MNMTDEMMLQLARTHGLVTEDGEPINRDANTIDTKTVVVDPRRRKQIIALLQRAFLERDKRVKRTQQAQEEHRALRSASSEGLREGWTNEAEPVQSADNTAPPTKKRILKFAEWRAKNKIEINPEKKNLGFNPQLGDK